MHIDALKILRTYIDGEGNITYKVKLADGRRVRVNNTELIDLVSKYKCINASITPTYPLRVKKIFVEK
jgi:hypothetical protein